MFRRYHSNISTLLLLSIVAFSVIDGKLGSLKKEDDKKKICREGTGVLIPCNVTESPNIKVWWTKNKSHSTFHQDDIVLRFNVVSRLDGGTYLCHAQNLSAETNATVVDHVFLDVQYPGEAPEFFISNSRLMENDTFTIDAVVEGNPAPTYMLLNNDTGSTFMRANLPSNFSLNFKAYCFDMGYFMVTGYNKLNKKNFTRSGLVTVLCSPRPNINKYNTYTVYAALGGNTSLQMYSAGYPYPQFVWYHNNESITHRSTLLTPLVSAIFFNETSLSDFGDYYLTMTNEYGHFTTKYQLIAQGPPGRPTGMKVLKVNDHSIELGWSTGYDYGLPQIVHIVRWIGNKTMDIAQVYVQTNSAGFQYVEKEVAHLNSSTSYIISLVSKNIYGTSQFSEEINFVTKDEKPRSHSSVNLSLMIPVSIVSFLALIAVVFAIVHVYRITKKGSSVNTSEKKHIIN